jgi:lytic murein transglycosylase
MRVPAAPTAAAAAVQAVAPAAYTFANYKQWLMSRARREGVREATVQAHVPGLVLNSRAMQLDRENRPVGPSNSPYFSAFAPYRQRHVNASLINRGQSRYSQYYAYLRQVETRYGVDPAVLMAIYGHETSYGSVTGSFDLLEVLASLAYEGRRREMFESEFVAALKLIDAGIPRRRLKGSYAGATGYPQFMPSTVLRLRVDGDGDGYADLWANEMDGLASIANYLRDAGWKPNVPWGVAVRTPATLNRAAIRNKLTAERCPRVFQRHSRWLTSREWRSLGVVPYGRSIADTEMATLIEPDGPNNTAYLLTTNYRAILDYNCSNFYALSVGLLADAIARR